MGFGSTGPKKNLLEDSMREITIMKKLKHRNCIGLYEIITDSTSEKIYLILELAEKGPIMDYDDDEGVFNVNKKISEGNENYSLETIKIISRGIIRGLAYLHANGIIHRDIKPDNVLLSDDGEAKISNSLTSRL